MSAALAALRQDIRLVPGPAEPSGAPTWQLVDPLRHQYFRIGWMEFECLARWRAGDADRVAADVSAQTTLDVRADDVHALQRFLASQQLLQLRDAPAVPAVPAWQRAYMKLVYHRVPLAHPQALLDRLLPLTARLWRRRTLALLGGLALLSLWLLGLRAPEIVADLRRYANAQGVLLGFAVLAVTKTLHELGHGVTCRRYGVRVPALGVAFVFLWPMPYVDTSDTWRLLDRGQRLVVALAGVATELLLALLAGLAWLYLPPGTPRDVCLFVAVLSWAMSIVVNLNPLMRFDGYYALVDATGLDNLQTRAFALARWRLTTALGRSEPPPEDVPPARRHALLAYGAAAIVYRAGVYLGVTALVFARLPSAIALPLVAAGWYLLVLRPLALTLQPRDVPPSRRLPLGLASRLPPGPGLPSGLRGTLAACTLLPLLWFGLPLPRVLDVPAVQSSAAVHALHVSEPALWLRWRVRHGEAVRAGQSLALLRSPELERDILRQQLLLQRLERGHALRGLQDAFSDAADVSEESVSSARATLDALLLRRARLELRAPASGRVYFDANDLSRPRWLAADTRVATLVGGGGVVQAFLDPTERARLDLEADARFYPSDCAPACAPATARLRAHDELASALAVPPRLQAFAGAHGHDVYRLLLGTAGAAPDHERFGRLRLRTRPVSPLTDALRRGLGVLRRELGV